MLDEQRELTRVLPVRVDAGVGPEREFHARLDGPRPVRVLLATKRSLLLDDLVRQMLFGAMLEDVYVRDDVRHEIRAVLFHDPHAFFVHQAAVLDRCDAGARRALDRLGAVRVRRNLVYPYRSFGDDDVELLLRVLRRACRLLFREHARALEYLDPVGAALDVLSHLLAHLVDAVRDP